jgi:hypothetical protein
MTKLAMPIAGLLVLAACSTEGKVTPLANSAVPLPAASTWALSVRGCPETSQCEEIRTSLADRLIGTGLAERIVAAGRPADLSLDVLVNQVRTVSGVERVFLGVIAGRNEVASTDTLRDRTGAVLRSFRVESASASHPLSGESGLSDSYRRFATETVSALH